MRVETYLLFRGECREAFEFYHSVLGGTMVTMMAHRGSPAEAHVPEEWKDKILHARLEIDGYALMASDGTPGRQSAAGGFNVSITMETIEQAERTYAALSEGARQITMAMGETFWAKRFGMFTDRFGVPWMVSSAV